MPAAADAQKAKTREAEGYAGSVMRLMLDANFVVGAKGFEPSTL
jgi:hypothetical protein